MFTTLRNQVIHGGMFHAERLRGALEDAAPDLCNKYIELFEAMTASLARGGYNSDQSSEHHVRLHARIVSATLGRIKRKGDGGFPACPLVQNERRTTPPVLLLLNRLAEGDL